MSTDPWRTLRIRRRWMLGIWLGWLPVLGLLMSVQDTALPPPWSALVGLAYLSCVMVSGLRYGGTPCPCCGKRFVSLLGFNARAQWSWRCDGCSTKLGATLATEPVRRGGDSSNS